MIRKATAILSLLGLHTGEARLRGSSAAKLRQPLCSVLALSGGGSFGAVQMGILDGLTAAGQVPARYDIVTGISAGGLNAGFLSYYDNVTVALPAIYGILANLTNADIYTAAPLSILSEWSYYNTAPLEQTVATVLGGLSPAATAPLVLVGASNVLTKELDVWRFGELDLVGQVDALMATSAIPLVFPPREVNGSLYVDGGVISNEMIAQAIGQLECDSYQVVFISASARNQTAGPMPTGLWSYMSAVMDLLLDTFDYQLAQQGGSCAYPRGTINACFPTAPALDNYSILDFDHGAALYALGKEAFACETLDLC